MIMNETDYEQYLHRALDRLFQPVEELGFWHQEDNRIIFKHDMKGETLDQIIWTPDLKLEYRYGPYALMGVLYWRQRTHPEETAYDDKIKAFLAFLKSKVSQEGAILGDDSGINHGLVLASFCLGILNFPGIQTEYHETIDKMYQYSLKRWPVEKIDSNQDYILLWGYTWLYELYQKIADKRAEDVLAYIRTFIKYMVSVQAPMGAFDSGDPRYIYHQRIFLPLWGFFKGLGFLKGNIPDEEWRSYHKAGKRGFSFATTRRMLSNGGFYWHEYLWLYKKPSSPLGRGVKFNPRKFLFYEVHQCLFAVAVAEYFRATEDSSFNIYLKRAVDWIFTTNPMGLDFVEKSKLDMPFRLLTKDGGVFFQDNLFKGTYETGIYIMALTDLLEIV